MKLSELAARLDCRLEGDGELDVTRVAGIQDAQPGDITFLANPKYEKLLATTRRLPSSSKEDVSAAPCAMLRARDPYLAFARAVSPFAPVSRPAPGVHALAAIAGGAHLGADVSVDLSSRLVKARVLATAQ